MKYPMYMTSWAIIAGRAVANSPSQLWDHSCPVIKLKTALSAPYSALYTAFQSIAMATPEITFGIKYTVRRLFQKRGLRARINAMIVANPICRNPSERAQITLFRTDICRVV